MGQKWRGEMLACAVLCSKVNLVDRLWWNLLHNIIITSVNTWHNNLWSLSNKTALCLHAYRLAMYFNVSLSIRTGCLDYELYRHSLFYLWTINMLSSTHHRDNKQTPSWPQSICCIVKEDWPCNRVQGRPQDLNWSDKHLLACWKDLLNCLNILLTLAATMK